MTSTNTSAPSARRRRRSRKRPRVADNQTQPLPIHDRVASHFNRADRQRGSELVRQGRVHPNVDGTRVRARVQAKSGPPIGVGIDWARASSKRTLAVFCQCKRFADGVSCEHLWAVFQSLGQSGTGPQPAGGDRLSLNKEHQARWGDLAKVMSESPAPPPSKPQPPRKARKHTDRPPAKGRNRRAGGAPWRAQLEALRGEVDALWTAKALGNTTPPEVPKIRFLLNASSKVVVGGAVLDVFTSGAGTKTGKPKAARLDPAKLEDLLRPQAEVPIAQPTADEEQANEASAAESVAVVTALPAEPRGRQGRGRGGKARAEVRHALIPPSLFDSVLPDLCARRLLGWWDGRRLGKDLQPLTWDSGPAWRLVLRLEVNAAEGAAYLRTVLEREAERVRLGDVVAVLPAGHDVEGPSLVLFKDHLARLEMIPEQDLPWFERLQNRGEIAVPTQELEEAMAALFELPALPRLELPAELELAEEGSPPRPQLLLESDRSVAWMNLPFMAELSFYYGSFKVDAGDPRPAIIDWQQQIFVRREMDAEHRALLRLLELGLMPVSSDQGHSLQLEPDVLSSVAEPLLFEGWDVEVHGTSLKAPSPLKLKVESGIDWFELGGELDFAGEPIDLSVAMAATSRGDRFIKLADGSKGLLPESWMDTYDSLSQLAQDSTDTGLRFLPSQALIIDSLLASMPPVDVDKEFSRLRERLRSMESIKPKKELKAFSGTLRGYQRDGLGWLSFLREFGLGGVLADDMGLGKTVQVLALLLAYRTPAKSTKIPFLVVAPRSLVYNWIEEARRFTPKLKVLEYAGSDREAMREKLEDYDLVVTTYGTLRNDIGYLIAQEFDTVILDEAQAIKNRDSLAAQASRRLVSRHRLCLTGTPIENHIGELGSLFEFLNPGLFGRLSKLDALVSGKVSSKKELQLVAEGIRPFILRRTKEEVLPDLPPKTEQTLHCSLTPRQRELYDQLRAQLQANLLQKVEGQGMGGSTFQVLEALLRLRQIACHPGLVNPEWEEAGSAKLEALFSHISEVLAEGHKVIVFSQFTKLLAYVQKELVAREVNYAYLDGQTRNRGEVVDRFQTDPDCNLFLISIKAGGVGLNLTAAEYVFLLDPWWNPAVEAQAIDRAHRIGQTQPVFAYRMIARDTVEEKILELQQSKRELADAILEGDGRLMSELTSDDLRMLLS